MGRLLGLVLLVVVAFLAWKYTQGSKTTVPNAPNVNLPKVDNPEDLAKKGADGLAGLPEWVWSFAVPLVIVLGIIAWVRAKHPKLFWFALGVGFILFFIYVMKAPH